MDKSDFDRLKERIHITRERIISMFTDMNGVNQNLIEQLNINLGIFEADLIAYGGYIENECTKENIVKAELEVLKKQSAEIDNNNEIRMKSFEIQKRNAEMQEELIQSQKESVIRQTERDKIALETEQKMMSALESIAYSLAKLTVNKTGYVFKDNNDWKHSVECKTGE